MPRLVDGQKKGASTDQDCRADDKSQRYVAEENIEISYEMPGENLMALAGRYFKRWDNAMKVFVSNIKDEYPDD